MDQLSTKAQQHMAKEGREEMSYRDVGKFYCDPFDMSYVWGHACVAAPVCLLSSLVPTADNQQFRCCFTTLIQPMPSRPGRLWSTS